MPLTLTLCLPAVHPHACALRSLLVHGSLIAQRNPGELSFNSARSGPENTTALKRVLSFLSLVLVFRSPEAVQHAGQASARLHLPSPRPSEEGAPLHHRPAQLPGPAVGHQDVQGRHRFPHDGNQSRKINQFAKTKLFF